MAKPVDCDYGIMALSRIDHIDFTVNTHIIIMGLVPLTIVTESALLLMSLQGIIQNSRFIYGETKTSGEP